MAAATASEMVTKYNEAIQACLLGQSYEINGRRMTRADLGLLENGLQYWENVVRKEAGGDGIVLAELGGA